MIASQSYDPLHYGVLSSDDHTIILTQGRAYVKTYLHYLQKRDIIIPYYLRKRSRNLQILLYSSTDCTIVKFLTHKLYKRDI